MPFNRLVCYALFLLTFHLACSDKTRHQAEFRGTWNLQSRKLPQGHELHTPAISGLLEWFPLSPQSAHVVVTQTAKHEAIQILDAIYTLEGNAFSVNSKVRIGGHLGSEIDGTYQTGAQESRGTIASDDARQVLTHPDGTRFEFIGAQLTIYYPNGTIDRWKRQRDQRGALPN